MANASGTLSKPRAITRAVIQGVTLDNLLFPLNKDHNLNNIGQGTPVLFADHLKALYKFSSHIVSLTLTTQKMTDFCWIDSAQPVLCDSLPYKQQTGKKIPHPCRKRWNWPRCPSFRDTLRDLDLQCYSTTKFSQDSLNWVSKARRIIKLVLRAFRNPENILAIYAARVKPILQY